MIIECIGNHGRILFPMSNPECKSQVEPLSDLTIGIILIVLIILLMILWFLRKK